MIDLTNNLNLTPLIPELTLAGGILLLLIVDLLAGRNKGAIIAALGSILLLAAAIITISAQEEVGSYLFGSVIQDGMTVFFRLLFCLAGIISLGLLSFRYKEEGEPYILVMASILGMFFLAGANDIITLFVALEMVSIPSYVLAGYLKNNLKSAEAALKYVIYGAVSSGLMVWGFSLLYGISGTTNIGEMFEILGRTNVPPLPHMVGLVLVLAGIGYKIAMVPFHFWCPDVYEGSPTAVTAYFSVAPKAAGFAALFRLMPVFVTLHPIYGISAVGMFTLASALTMTFGNLGAIWQDSVKRLLAYSSIAHAGYLLMGFAVLAEYPAGDMNSLATAAVMFYLVVYLFMNFGAFLIVDAVERNLGGDSIKWFRGLGKTSPIPAIALSIFLFSLVGLPPLAGFVGKFYLFAALIKGKLFALALIAIANTVVSLFYYVRIVRDMFLLQPEGEVVEKGLIPTQLKTLGSVLAIITILPTLILGLFWAQLANWIGLRIG